MGLKVAKKSRRVRGTRSAKRNRYYTVPKKRGGKRKRAGWRKPGRSK